MSLIYGINPVYEAISSGKTINKIYVQKSNKELNKLDPAIPELEDVSMLKRLNI